MRFQTRVIALALLLLSAACGRGGDPTACGGPAARIGTIQGSTSKSPHGGEQVTIEGVVAASFPGAAGLGGFILQDIEDDEDPATSDGILVAAPRAEVAKGQRLRVTGTIAELGGNTALAGIGTPMRCGIAEVEPRALSLSGSGDLEATEAMLVQIEETLDIADLYDLARRGRFVVSTGGRLWASTNGDSAAEERQVLLIVDDGSVLEPPASVPVLESGRPPRVGDRLGGLTGVMLEAEDGFVLHRTDLQGFEVRNPRPTSPPEVGGTLRAAAFNVLNYFTTLGTRGADSAAELERQEAKIVAALVALDADLIALIEIENGGPALSRMIAALNASSAAHYRAAGDPSASVGDDAIRVALIYRTPALEARGPLRVLDDPVFRNRPMIAQTFRAGDETFTAVAAHWKSKGGCNDAEGADRDQGDGQGCWNDLRVRQARRSVDLIAELQQKSRDADVLLLGDLNAYGAEDPILLLAGGVPEGGDLVDLVARHVGDPESRYSYVYRGSAGRLDHAFATSKLAAKITGAAYWHINADESRALDYKSENPEELFRPDAYRSSDHDPLIVGAFR